MIQPLQDIQKAWQEAVDRMAKCALKPATVTLCDYSISIVELRDPAFKDRIVAVREKYPGLPILERFDFEL